jgi:hypothetical protein
LILISPLIRHIVGAFGSSRRVADIRTIDNTICTFSIEMTDRQCEFSRFFSLSCGEMIVVSKSNVSFYKSLSEGLLDEEFPIAISEGNDSDIIGENVFARRRRENCAFSVYSSLGHRLVQDISRLSPILENIPEP